MAQPLTVNIPHQLGKAEARKRLDEGVDRFSQQFGGASANFQKRWDADSLNFSADVMGQSIRGVMHVLEDAVRMEVVLPGILGMMAGKVRDKLQREGQILLEKK